MAIVGTPPQRSGAPLLAGRRRSLVPGRVPPVKGSREPVSPRPVERLAACLCLRVRPPAKSFAIVALLGSLFAAAAVLAQRYEVTEYQVKAAYLYNFPKFIEWPADSFRGAGDPIVICVAGGDAFLQILERTVAGKSVEGRKFLVKRWKPDKNRPDCHILFVGQPESKRLPDILDQLGGASVLLVGESTAFAQQGGIINFVLAGDNVRFEINVEAAKRAKLKIGSQLLSLAILVEGKVNGKS